MKQQEDPLKRLFEQIGKEELPDNFRANIMQRVLAEAERKRRLHERLGLATAIIAALAMLSMAAASFIYVGLPPLKLPELPDRSLISFYSYIGTIALLLLLADYLLRRFFRKKQYTRLHTKERG